MDLGSSRVVPLISIHGGPGIDSTYLRSSVLSQIQIPGVAVTFIDLPGHGINGFNQNSEFTLDTCTSAVIGLAEHLDADHFDILGHSFGGFVALHTALLHPERVRRLILVGTSAGPVNITAPSVKTDEDTALYFRQKWPRFFSRDDCFWNVLEASTFSAMPFNKGFKDIIPSYDLHDDVCRLRPPTALLAGDGDGFLPAMRILESEMSGAELHVIPNCGHMPFLEAPTEFSDILLHFYASKQSRNIA